MRGNGSLTTTTTTHVLTLSNIEHCTSSSTSGGYMLTLPTNNEQAHIATNLIELQVGMVYYSA